MIFFNVRFSYPPYQTIYLIYIYMYIFNVKEALIKINNSKESP